MVMVSSEALACDICGCAMSGNYGGIYPQFTKSIIGFRYGFQRFQHPNTDLNFNGTSRVLRDEFSTYELWGRFYPHPRIQVFAFVPFKNHVREETERITGISGIGDASLMINYTLFNTADSTYSKWGHALLLGLGVKLPTARYFQRDETGALLPAQFQLGTGAYTFSFHSNYTLRYDAWGLNFDYAHRMNEENERSYQFGDQQAASANLFYRFTPRDFAVLPNAGFSFEYYGTDTEFGMEKEQTGGELWLANAGADIYFNRFFFRCSVQVPLRQKIPFAQPKTEPRLSLGIAYTY